MRRLALTALLLLLPLPAWAQTILAGHPVTAGLAQALTQGTALTVEKVVPDAIPMGRQNALLTGRGEAKLADAAKKADAVLTLRSVWIDDPVYPLARRHNIRLVEIDAARPVDGALPGVALRDGAAFPWLGVANAGRMADIVAADLRRLYPNAAPAIDGNLANLKRALLTLSSTSVRTFAGLPDPSVAALSDRFAMLAADLGLDLRKVWTRDDRDWTPERLAELTAFLKAERIPAVLHHRQPAPEIAQAITAGGARLIVLDSLESGPPAAMDIALGRMVEQLETGLR
ncbi:metal ABC transporter solute-binding protein, Zn/Mn family [Azospirillum doebereinerae]|uniref:Zinc ABC transporter substrate-binding protein n=1 Tax=Azospirillum doebereinerae TaxID=92933 RepID=A0A3S0WL91_9PROT|nr:zinc ABC transporter substrate-binding protein [Azospirillum doebereinerae]MCG5241853.1 zinc ABC transporter substrate-binding protein [Azospirillum doebereinerae]RUQ69373.1 zinc ABC transporter substrate-binding protein [Azospirillum doebereinerae]